jgi:hypothetical protein
MLLEKSACCPVRIRHEGTKSIGEGVKWKSNVNYSTEASAVVGPKSKGIFQMDRYIQLISKSQQNHYRTGVCCLLVTLLELEAPDSIALIRTKRDHRRRTISWQGKCQCLGSRIHREVKIESRALRRMPCEIAFQSVLLIFRFQLNN